MPDGYTKYTIDLPEETEHEPDTYWGGFMKSLGGLRGVLAGGVRAGSGLASLTGGIPGAAISGAGELAAEQIEDFGSTPHWGRVATEAGLGAIPFTKVLKLGKPVASAIRGSMLSGGGTAAREIAEGQPLDPRAILTHAAIGGVSNAAFAKMLGGGAKAATAAPEALQKYEIETTAHPGGQVIGPKGKGPTPVKPIPPQYGPAQPSPGYLTSKAAYQARQAAKAAPVPATGPPVPPVDVVEEGYRGIVQGTESGRVQKVIAAEEKAAARQKVTDLKLFKQEQALESIRTGREEAGVVAKPPSFSKSLSAPTEEGGRESMAIRYAKPKKEGEGEVNELSDLLTGTSKTKAADVSDIPPEGRAADIYAAWIAKGRDPKTALKLAQKGKPPLEKPGTWSETESLPPGEVTPPPVEAAPSPLAKALGVAPRARTSVKTPEGFEKAVQRTLSKVEQPSETPTTWSPYKPDEFGNMVSRPVAAPAGELSYTTRQAMKNLGYSDESLQKMTSEEAAAEMAINDEIATGKVTPPASFEELITPKPSAASPERVAARKAVRDAGWADVEESAAKLKGVTEGAQQDIAQAAKPLEVSSQTLAPEPTIPGKGGVAVEPPAPPSRPAEWDQYPPEVVSELDQLGSAYRAAPAGPEKRALGGKLSEIRDFFTPGKMRESWRGAPLEGPAPTPPGYKAPETFDEGVARIAADRAANPEKYQGGVGLRQAADEATANIDDMLGRGTAPVDYRLQNKLKTEPSATAAPTEVEQAMGRAGNNFIDRLVNSGKKEPIPSPFSSVKQVNPKFGGEKGAIDPMLLARLGLGVGGAVTGYAADPLDNPLASAAAGMAVGVGAPSIVSKLMEHGVPPNVAQAVGQTPMTAETIKDTAKKLVSYMPQIQRMNYLLNEGLLANIFVGPWGSAFMGALEHGLSGDPRGWAAIKLLNPFTFVKNTYKAYPEAATLAGGRGETSIAENIGEKVLSAPGSAMTAGDIAARDVLRAAEFSDEEARVITLTSEPEIALGRNINVFGKRRTEGGKPSILAQMMFPFKRTATNIMEQGGMRLPGVGSIVQASRDVADPRKTQAIQQLMDLGIGFGSYEVGKNVDPETAKWLKRYVSNVAGQHSLGASIGFGMGQAQRRGKPAWGSVPQSAMFGTPLPTAQPIFDWAKAGVDLFSGEPSIPRGALPGFIREGRMGPFPNLSSFLEGTPGEVAPEEEEIPDIPFRR